MSAASATTERIVSNSALLFRETDFVPFPREQARPGQVMVVEDDAPIRALLTDLLVDAGYGVAEAADGRAALNLLAERQPDLVVLDLMLPAMSGWEFLNRARDELERLRIPVMIVSAIDGRSDYPSTLGVAAWFTKPFDVPQFLGAVEQLAGKPEPPKQALDVEPASLRRVLIVEDDATIRDLLKEQLETDGCAVDLAGSIAGARSRIELQRPDLILLDLMLPVEDGWSFLRSRRANITLASIPVIAMSAAPHALLVEAQELGADAWLSKPFELDALTALVHSFVGEQDPYPGPNFE